MANVAKILQNFIKTRREMWLHWAVWFVLMFTGILSASFYLTAAHPAAGEIMQGALIRFGLLVNYGLIAAALLVFLGYMAHTAGRDVTITFYPVSQIGVAPVPRALPEYTIGNDIIVTATDDQTPEDWAANVDAAEKQANRARWAVVIPFRSPVFHLFTGATAEIYSRDEAAFKMPETFPDFDGRVCGPRMFTEETPEDYATYCERFRRIFREWSPREKAARAAGRSAAALLEVVKNSANILLLLLVSVPAFSQSKTRQVDDALGTRIREIPAPGEDVSFVFDINGKTKSFNRMGDGKSEYTDLLRKVPGLGEFNDEGGRLLYITKGTDIVARAAGVERVNDSPRSLRTTKEETMRPHSAVDPGALSGDGNASLPDSAEIQRSTDAARRWIDEARSEAWARVKPLWGLAMYVFWSIFLMLVCLIGLARYVAKTAANESLINTYGRVIVGRWVVSIQQNAAAATLVMSWVIFGVLLVNLFLTLVWLGFSPWVIVVIWFPTLWLAGGITNWLVPNLKVVQNNERGLTTF